MQFLLTQEEMDALKGAAEESEESVVDETAILISTFDRAKFGKYSNPRINGEMITIEVDYRYLPETFTEWLNLTGKFR